MCTSQAGNSWSRFRPLRVHFRILEVDFGRQKLILDVCDLGLGSGVEIYLKFDVLGLLE